MIAAVISSIIIGFSQFFVELCAFDFYNLCLLQDVDTKAVQGWKKAANGQILINCQPPKPAIPAPDQVAEPPFSIIVDSNLKKEASDLPA